MGSDSGAGDVVNTAIEAITVEELSYTYPDGTVALQSLSFRIHVGECFGLIGPNGAGKSTLLLLLNGVIEGPGRVWLLGQSLALFNEQKLPRRMSMVFENPDDQLFMSTVFDDVAFGAINLGLDDNTVRQRVQAALEAVGMEDFAARPPYHLSLGEKKRVALATVLVMDCEIIALDEPTSGLDPAGREEFIQLLDSLPMTKIIAAHDMELIEQLCDRVAVLDEGKIAAVGPASDILGDEELLRDHKLRCPLTYHRVAKLGG
ncbi:MAG: ABC transporter ATP-binding protein [Armatimonadetes bacterium]|nr:ABC transporter ATP-binding protein [Armatimonadota bacterium]